MLYFCLIKKSNKKLAQNKDKKYFFSFFFSVFKTVTVFFFGELNLEDIT